MWKFKQNEQCRYTLRFMKYTNIVEHQTQPDKAAILYIIQVQNNTSSEHMYGVADNIFSKDFTLNITKLVLCFVCVLFVVGETACVCVNCENHWSTSIFAGKPSHMFA